MASSWLAGNATPRLALRRAVSLRRRLCSARAPWERRNAAPAPRVAALATRSSLLPQLSDCAVPPGAAAALAGLPGDDPRVVALLASLRVDYDIFALRVPPAGSSAAVKALTLKRLLNWPRLKNVLPQTMRSGTDTRLLLLAAEYAAMDEKEVARAVADGAEAADAAAERAADAARRARADAAAGAEGAEDTEGAATAAVEGRGGAGGCEREAEGAGQRQNEQDEPPLFKSCVVRHALSLPYSFWGVDETIAHLLPADVPVARSFETVGHVAHLNLREEHAPYAALIARVILDKNASSGTGIKTVVRKTGEVGGTFRTYPLEVLGGEDSTETQLIEHGTTLRLDLSDVYWSSRLGTERQRLLALLQPDDVVWDAFAGVGPLAVPAAKRCARVLANDLNPRCVEFMQHNAKRNRAAQRLRARCGDARDFLRDAASRSAAMPRGGTRGRVHIHMNLPHDVFSFMETFRGAFPQRLWRGRPMPIVHAYSFQKLHDSAGEPEARAKAEVWRIFGDDVEVTTRLVRDVAPGKTVCYVEFQLPRHFALALEDEER